MGRFDGFKKAVNEALEAGVAYYVKVETVKSLMETSEPSGLKRIDALVPRIHREGWMDDFLSLLVQQMHSEVNSAEVRQKAKTFYSYARDVWQNQT